MVVCTSSRESHRRESQSPGEPQPTQEERIKALEDQNETLLQCILEMSEIVYA